MKIDSIIIPEFMSTEDEVRRLHTHALTQSAGAHKISHIVKWCLDVCSTGGTDISESHYHLTSSPIED